MCCIINTDRRGSMEELVGVCFIVGWVRNKLYCSFVGGVFISTEHISMYFGVLFFLLESFSHRVLALGGFNEAPRFLPSTPCTSDESIFAYLKKKHQEQYKEEKEDGCLRS